VVVELLREVRPPLIFLHKKSRRGDLWDSTAFLFLNNPKGREKKIFPPDFISHEGVANVLSQISDFEALARRGNLIPFYGKFSPTWKRLFPSQKTAAQKPRLSSGKVEGGEEWGAIPSSARTPA
jgi:hypothetical protein